MRELIELNGFTCLHEGGPAITLLHVATVGENFKRLREARKMTPAEVARASGMPISQVSDLEAGRYVLPDTRTLLKVAKALKCTVDDLLDDVDQDYQQVLNDRRQDEEIQRFADDVEQERLDVSGHTRDDIPIVVEGEASPSGNLFWTDDGQLQSDVEDRITRPHDVDDPRAYGLRIRGDSMLPIYRPRMVVVVSPNTPVTDGDEVYVELLSGERLIKIARRTTDGWILESANPAYPPRFVPRAQIGTMHPIVWSKRRPSGPRIVDGVKKQLEHRIGQRRGRVKESRVGETVDDVAASRDVDDENGGYGEES